MSHTVPQIRQSFYDIESLSNVFTLCNFNYNDNTLDVYILCDDTLDTNDTDKLVLTENMKQYINQQIYEKNKNFNGSVAYHDLHEFDANLHLINTFGAKDNDNNFEKFASINPNFKMFINDFDIGYDNKIHEYLFGYNSFNYDMTELALYINETFWIDGANTLNFTPPTARDMRDFNDNLFTNEYKERMPSYLKRTKKDGNNNTIGGGFHNRENIIRNNMLKSGRYIDVAKLNEKMQKVALKRVLGLLGYQILESDKLRNKTTIYTVKELADLVAYNTSDVVNLKLLFDHPIYQANFELKKGLLETYPALIYNQKKVIENGEEKTLYEPDVKPENVRYDRLYIDSSSANVAARTLCPYGTLNDIEAVSFMYPSEAKAKELGIKRVNVLDECYVFFYNLYKDNLEVFAEFKRIYDYYKNNIEGKNFNDSDAHAIYTTEKGVYKPSISMADIPKQNMTLTYFNKDGTPSSCYVCFGIGGIHGAEYNAPLYMKHLQEYEQLESLHALVKQLYPDPLMLKQKNPETKKAWTFEHEGETYKPSDFLKTGSTMTKAEWKDISKKKPELFKVKTDGTYTLNKKYNFTSAAICSHEDFESYYPNLLRMMEAFFNAGLGYDRYAEIFENKQKYGKLMKDESLTEAERNRYDILRDGTKLILNSASGAADATFFTPIRMNNSIMSMRIIGQLFTWRIGQAQTYEGADIISTNTDGLYSVFDFIENEKILERESKNINVNIEPEPCYLVSKDSNNRLEVTNNGKNISVSGGSLSCAKGPNPTKSLTHPAIIDWALCEYLRNADDIHGVNNTDYLSEKFDLEKGKAIFEKAKSVFTDKAKYLNMFQILLASSIGSQRYIFGETDNFKTYKDKIINTDGTVSDLFKTALETEDIKILPHYNRVFIVDENLISPSYTLSNACSRAVSPASRLNRQKKDERIIQHDPFALAVLSEYEVFKKDIITGKEAIISKTSGIDADWHVFTENKSLFELTDDEITKIINSLNMTNYLTMLESSFNKNWQNEI